ncbi:MAG: DUF2500 domain-containing protein [Oscillospiraceae bacterium]|nr:DUF2500 domain-containing protein [Oscillospiraceae bacterium]
MMIGFGFGAFEIVIFLVFALVFGIIIFTVIRKIGEQHRNNNSPRLVVEAEVVTKREDVSHTSMPVAGDATGAHGFLSSSDTSYYVTFEVKGGDRLEFCVKGSEYGQLAEGDRGELTFQGTQYIGFDRYRQ